MGSHAGASMCGDKRNDLRKQRDYAYAIARTTDRIVNGPIKLSTEVAYNKMLDEWDEFSETYEGEATIQNVKVLKDFLVHFAFGRTGCIDKTKNMMTQKSLHASWKCFMAAWQRKTGDTFSSRTQTTIRHIINGGEELESQVNFSKEERPVRNFTLQDFQACVSQLWQNDWYDSRSESYRVGLHLTLLLHASTAVRSAEYVTNLRYGDTDVWLTWLEDRSQPIIVINLCRKHLKGHEHLPRQQPKHLLYELTDQPCYHNTVAFFLSKVLAMDGFCDFHSWAEICAISKKENRTVLPLNYQDHVLERPVFSRVSSSGIDNDQNTSTSLIPALANLGERTGFRDRVTPHAIRREHLLQVDAHGYSINERMRHAGHLNPNTYAAHYQCAISAVDGQATYLGLKKQGSELHELFRGFSLRRNHHYNPLLPSKLQRDLDQAYTLPKRDNQQPPVERQRIYKERHQEKMRLLQQNRCQSINDWTSGRDEMIYESDFHQARKLMPERNRLAGSLFERGSLRGPVGMQIMNDLVYLCSQNNSNTFCTTLNRNKDLCDTCGSTRVKTNVSWWQHVYRCRRKHARAQGRSEQFYFLYLEWITGEDRWATHTEQHLSNLPLKCKLKMFRGNVIRPGLCIECLSNPDLPPARRMSSSLTCHNGRSMLDNISRSGSQSLSPADILAVVRCFLSRHWKASLTIDQGFMKCPQLITQDVSDATNKAWIKTQCQALSAQQDRRLKFINQSLETIQLRERSLKGSGRRKPLASQSSDGAPWTPLPALARESISGSPRTSHGDLESPRSLASMSFSSSQKTHDETGNNLTTANSPPLTIDCVKIKDSQYYANYDMSDLDTHAPCLDGPLHPPAQLAVRRQVNLVVTVPPPPKRWELVLEPGISLESTTGKPPSPKRKRGRPPKQAPDMLQKVPSMVSPLSRGENSSPRKRPRGRPRGSKNKVKKPHK